METLKLALERIVPSKTNPRKNFDKAEMAELEASIKEHDVIQPILVRPIDGNGKPLFEIVAGERRFRAARSLGLSEIPAIQRELSDEEARQIQVIENLQRSDLHPLEEAEGYKGLIEKHKLTPEDIAAKVGKSKTYVYQRLKLLSLSPAARAHFLKGTLSPSVALLFARIPDARLQAHVLKEILESCEEGEAPSHASVLRHIQENYMMRLENAPFDTKDAGLFPKAGPCTTCPKRTGNQKELFQDVQRADVCTDIGCFQEKVERAWAIRARAARGKGMSVIEGEEAEKICAYGYVNRTSGYVDLNAKCYDDPKGRSWKQITGNALPPVTLVRTSEGKVYELAREKELLESLKKAGVKIKEEDSPTNDDYRREAAKQRQIAKLKQAVFVKAVEAIVGKVEGYELKEFSALITPMVLCNSSFESQWPTAKRRGIVDKRSMDTREKLEKAISELSEPARNGFIVELLVSGDRWTSYSGFGENFKLACKDAKVDLQKIEAEAKAELETAKRRPRKGR